MKNSTDTGFDQHDNAQVAVDQASLLIVGHALSNHANDQAEVARSVASIPPAVGTPAAAALDHGYFSAAHIATLAGWGIAPSIATGREEHHQSWEAYCARLPAPPPDDASANEKMAYKLQTAVGQARYRLRKCTVEPVLGSVKEGLGFRQVSLRGEQAAAGEWWLVGLAVDLKRLHSLTTGYVCPVTGLEPWMRPSRAGCATRPFVRVTFERPSRATPG